MKTPNVFSLTTREQRTIVLIIIALVAGTIAMHYHDLKTPMPSATSTSSAPAAVDTEENDAQ